MAVERAVREDPIVSETGLAKKIVSEVQNVWRSRSVIFSMMSLKRQHSKKGNFVSSNAGLLERDFGYS